ncbi:hypothetical protein B0H14DRAFT_3505024 [Mycena olivaceomarginata]|nr:hypothetical protein B0H14DRAFT_3505024 [Mycena olivaceomarginata]
MSTCAYFVTHKAMSTWDTADNDERARIRKALGRSGAPHKPSQEHYREPRLAPLKKATLYVDGRVPVHQPASHEYYRCSLCNSVKAHPISYLCGHSHCYACIRIWLETEWSCPICEEIMTRPPHQQFSEENAIADMFPEWANSTQVEYSWDGLTFPGY